MNKAARRQIIRRTEQEKLDLIEAWEKSGLSIKRFCHQHHFSDSLFHAWLNKYRHRKEEKPAGPFVPVHLTSSFVRNEENAAAFAEVSLKGGSRISFHQPVSADYLRTLTA
jgi:transposase-like protein